VLDSNQFKCSLIELQPTGGFQHQIRAHLGYGLGCPVLGDHKYSHHVQMVPQVIGLSAIFIIFDGFVRCWVYRKPKETKKMRKSKQKTLKPTVLPNSHFFTRIRVNTR
jgi:hypothetical protein